MSLTDKDLPYQLALAAFDAISPSVQVGLMQTLGSAEAVFHASPGDLLSAGLKQPEQARKILEFKSFDRSAQTLQRLQSLGVTIVRWNDAAYPERLRNIAAFPVMLFCRGDVSLLQSERALAVVGSRDMTPYGEMVINRFVPEFVKSDFTVVSGMALGVDSRAHRVCLDQGGKTIAVLANGIDEPYPRSHRPLFEEIIAKGLLISEFPFAEDGPNKHLFPRRNRIVSGLSLGVLVAEAREKSGSLITARFAVEQNREVFAVPGDIDHERSLGCLQIIRDGAHPVWDAQDLLKSLGVDAVKNGKTGDLPFDKIATDHFTSPLERQIYELCAKESRSVDDILDAVSESPSSVSATITKMEIMGHLRQGQDRRYRVVG